MGVSVFNIEDAAANDSNKDFTFGETPVKVGWIHVKVVTTATVGNRTMVLEILDAASAVRYYAPLAPNIAAGLTRYINILPNATREAAFGGPGSDTITAQMPNMVIMPGWTLRIRDSAAIAAAADDITIYGQAYEAGSE